MEISDLISDIESRKLIGIASFGAITGAIAGMVNFHDNIDKSTKPIFRKLYDKVGKEGIKTMIAMMGGVSSVNYQTGNIITNIVEGLVYTAEFRLGYEIGHRGYNIVVNYLK